MYIDELCKIFAIDETFKYLNKISYIYKTLETFSKISISSVLKYPPSCAL